MYMRMYIHIYTRMYALAHLKDRGSSSIIHIYR